MIMVVISAGTRPNTILTDPDAILSDGNRLGLLDGTPRNSTVAICDKEYDVLSIATYQT
jgi:hypothetical protein